MKPDGTLTVDELLKMAEDLQVWEKEELAIRLGTRLIKSEEYDLIALVHFFDAEDILECLNEDSIVEYLENCGYEVNEL